MEVLLLCTCDCVGPCTPVSGFLGANRGSICFFAEGAEVGNVGGKFRSSLEICLTPFAPVVA